MVNFNISPANVVNIGNKEISVFDLHGKNIDKNTVKSFGDEWLKFDKFSNEDLYTTGDEYFDIVPENIYKNKLVLDIGCGTGRWSKYLSKKARFIEAIDPSDAVLSAATYLEECDNIRISQASIDDIPFEDDSFDFVFSLGVLHHIPNTQEAMNKSVKKVKHGGCFLVYLYYSLDGRGSLFRILFYISNIMRKVISRQNPTMKKIICDFLSIIIYLPFIFLSKFLKLIGLNELCKFVPLSYYSNKSMNIIRNDSLDRFGTPLEQRFSKNEIKSMMKESGLSNIVFSSKEPYWHAIGRKI